MLRLTGAASKVVHLPLPVDDPRRRRPDITKASKVLKWSPATRLDKGLCATIDWFRTRQPSTPEITLRHARFDRLSSNGQLATSG